MHRPTPVARYVVVVMSKLKPPVRLALKAALSAIAIGGLVAGVDWDQLPELIDGYRWEFAAAAFIGLMIQFPVSGLKWRTALRVCNVDMSFARLTRFYCISHFPSLNGSGTSS